MPKQHGWQEGSTERKTITLAILLASALVLPAGATELPRPVDTEFTVRLASFDYCRRHAQDQVDSNFFKGKGYKPRPITREKHGHILTCMPQCLKAMRLAPSKHDD